jgi:hypothetical protein
MTGKRLKGRLGGGAGYTVRTDDLMAEAGCLYHTSWIIDDQPWPINVRGGQKFIYVPYTGQTNDAGMLAWNREADYFLGLGQRHVEFLRDRRNDQQERREVELVKRPPKPGRPPGAPLLFGGLPPPRDLGGLGGRGHRESSRRLLSVGRGVSGDALRLKMPANVD